MVLLALYTFGLALPFFDHFTVYQLSAGIHAASLRGAEIHEYYRRRALDSGGYIFIGI